MSCSPGNNEAFLALEELGPDKFEIVVPSISIKAEPPIALVDATVDARGARKVAEAYLDYLYSDVGQSLTARHYYRPSRPEAVDPEELSRCPAGDHRRSRRLGQSTAGILRRRRSFRSDLQGREIAPCPLLSVPAGNCAG